MSHPVRRERLRDILLALAPLAILLAIPFEGIQWGDGLEFAAVASGLGVAHPPGYPLFTLLARMFLILPLPEPYAALVVMCRLIVWILGGVLFFLVRDILRRAGHQTCHLVAVPAAAGALFLFSPLIRDSLHAVEVYTLNAVLMAACAGALLYARESQRMAAVAGIALGLALANHLPALSLAPCAVFVLWATPARRWIAFGLPALLLPACLYGSLLLRVPSPDGYGIGWGGTANPGALFEHVRGGEYSRYQLLSLRPGVPLSAEHLTAFLAGRTLLMPQSLASLLPFPLFLWPISALIVAGPIIMGFRRLLKIEFWWTLGVLVAMGLQVGFIALYNIPDIQDYFIGVWVLAIPAFALGTIEILRSPSRTARAMLFLTVMAVGGAMMGWRASASLATIYRERLLQSLPEGATVLTSGDADIYTLWYEQHARGERRDLAVVGANFVRFPWFRTTLPASDPRRDAIQFFPGDPPEGPEAFISQIATGQIEPLLRFGPVYWSASQPLEVRLLERRFRVTPVARLLSDEELELILSDGLVNFPPPILFKIEPLSP